jgi:vancomycin resistance protein YoaR
VIIALGVVVVLGGASIGSLLYVRGLDTVYPNVYLAGDNLSGLTKTEAADRLRESGYERGVENARATIALPDGSTFTVTAEDAGLRPDANIAAKLAYDYGRDGNLFAQTFAYAKAKFSKTEIDASGTIEFDGADVRVTVEKAVAEFNTTLADDTYALDDDGVRIVKGAGVALANPEDVYTLTVDTLYDSLSEKQPKTAKYVISEDPDSTQEIDLAGIYNLINVEPVSAVYDPVTHTISESVTGVSFDMTAAQKAIDSATPGETVFIPFIFTEPEITKEMLEATLLHDVLAERTTNIAGTSNRLNNITLAAAAVNGTILEPGDTFSFNGIVGQRTAEKGYKEAGAYVGGKTVQEIGGGICQVSSTIYDCVLRSDLEVVERANHMFIVTYLPIGNDATINWGSIDFKFKNTTAYPLKIEAIVDGRTLSVKLYGTKEKTDWDTIKVTYETKSTIPEETEQMEDESVPEGQTKVDTEGHPGYVVETTKNYYDADWKLLRTAFIATSRYRPQNRIILVPVGTLTSPTPDEPTPTAGEPTPSSPPVSPTPTSTPAPATPEPTPEPVAPEPSTAAPATDAPPMDDE